MLIPLTASRRPLTGAMAATLVSLLWAAPAAGQTSLQIPLQFDFLNPGAKSRAMGGAFVAVADDASAVLANPAGLLLIPESEVSLELRRTSVHTQFLQGGRLSGEIFNEGIDTIQGAVFGDSNASDVGLGFVSGVYRHRSSSGGRFPWRLAGFRHELVRVNQSFLSNGVFQKAPEEFTSRRDSPQQGLRNVSITGYGGTFAIQAASQLAIGAGVTVYRFVLDSEFRRFDIDGFLGAPKLDVQIGRSTQAGEDTSVGPTLGAMWGVTTPWRLGVLYRRGASFEYETKDGNFPLTTGLFRVPHTFAIGASARVLQDTLTLSGEVTRVDYARLRTDFVTDQAVNTGRAGNFAIDSGTEVHFGLQYFPTTSYGAPQFRAGAWYDPNHSVSYRPQDTPVGATGRLFDERLQTALSTGKELVHYSGGVGFSPSSHFEVSAALDWSSQNRVFSASVILR